MVLKREEENIHIFQSTSLEIFYFTQETCSYLRISVCTPTPANNIYVKNISNSLSTYM